MFVTHAALAGPHIRELISQGWTGVLLNGRRSVPLPRREGVSERFVCGSDDRFPYSPPWQRRGKGWFGQFPERICEVADRTTPNPSFAKEGNRLHVLGMV